MRARLLSATLLTTTMLTAVPVFAHAQAAAPAPAADDPIEVIVTAQKRSEKLSNVPISIQVLSTKKLDQLNISDFKDYSALLPSVSFQNNPANGSSVIMRGVGSGGDGNHSGSLPSVGVYLDEQPVTTIGGPLDVHIYDIARIESLAGPQGTLYGASSEAGTIRIITNKPDLSGAYGRFDSDLNMVDGGGMGGKLEGMYNLPLGNKVALRAVAWYQKEAGYIDAVAGSRTFLGDPDGNGGYLPGLTVTNPGFLKKDYNDSEIYGGRAALKVDLDENWTVTGTLMAQDQRTNGNPGYDPSVGDLKLQAFYPESAHDRFAQAALIVQGKLGRFDLTYAGSYMERQVDTVSDYTDYAEAYDAAYASYGGIANYMYFYDNNGDAIDPRQLILGNSKYTKSSHEFRIASPSTDRLRFVAGAFVQHQTHAILQNYIVPGLADSMSVNGWPETVWLTKQDRIDRDAALFGEVSFDITPTLTVTAGGRSFTYDNTLIGFFGFGENPNYINGDSPNAVYGSSGARQCFTAETYGYTNPRDSFLPWLPASIAGTPCTNLGVQNADGSIDPKHAKGSGFSPKLNLSWKTTPDLLLYTTWSKGFRPGGINRRGTLPPYQSDYLSNIEFGWKATLADKKVRFNGAVYQQKWEKFQYSFLGLNSLTEVHNGPDADIKGIEGELTWSPNSHLTVQASGSIISSKILQNLCAYDGETKADCSSTIDTTYTDFSSGAPETKHKYYDDYIAAPAGTALPITPKYKFSANARYSWDMGNLSPYWQVQLGYQSSATTDIRVAQAALLGDTPAFTTLDLALGAEWQTWTGEIYIDNLSDERGQTGRYVKCSICYQRPYVLPITPRTFGVRLGSKF